MPLDRNSPGNTTLPLNEIFGDFEIMRGIDVSWIQFQNKFLLAIQVDHEADSLTQHDTATESFKLLDLGL